MKNFTNVFLSIVTVWLSQRKLFNFANYKAASFSASVFCKHVNLHISNIINVQTR